MVSQLELRTCGRAGCRWPAAASLSFRYDSRQAWLQDLAPAPHPALYDLCPHHADTLTVPRGWERVDERQPREAVHEPSSYDLEVLARGRAEMGSAPHRSTARSTAHAVAIDLDGRRPPAPGGQDEPVVVDDHSADHARAGRNRYAELTAALPELARVHGARAEDRRAEAAPLPSRELAPMAAEPAPPDDGSAPGADTVAAGWAGHDEPVTGQLAIPVDDLGTGSGEAVVVSIERAGGRRRSPSTG